MAYKTDISNTAYSPEYIQYREKIINEAFTAKNKVEDAVIKNDAFQIIIDHYKSADKRSYCGHTKIYNKSNELLHEYFNLYDHPFFCKRIQYSNGLDYIFYKEDLYGYSVYEIETKKVFNYFPSATFVRAAETFIGTDIHYNKNNNIFAVDGCYWACPGDVFLIKANNPMEVFGELVNIHEIIDPEYDKYDDIDFVCWENNNIQLKIDCKDIITLTEEDYKPKMVQI